MPKKGDPNVIHVYKEAGFLINLRHLTDEQIEQAKDTFQYSFYEESACSRCENLEARHNETCDSCDSFKGRRQLAKIVELEDSLLLSLPYGATSRVRSYIKSLGKPFVSVDRRPEPMPMSRRISLLREMRPWQKEAWAIALDKKRGIIEAPPRSGKTAFASSVISHLNQRTLVLAGQRDWLNQFRETFIGSDTSEKFTDALPRQVRFCKTYEQFMNTDVCLATFQQFMNKRGKKLLERIRDKFNVVMVDECHLAPALESARVLSRFNSNYRFGLSATPERKQERLINIVFDLIGPVIYRAVVEQLKPRVEVFETGLTFELSSSGNFTSFVNKLEYSTKRQDMIVEKIMEKVEEGHMVLVPMLRTKAIQSLVKKINESAEDHIAAGFYGTMKSNRAKTIEDARTYKIKVLVGNTKLLSTGLNIPRASWLFEATLSSNLPNCQQRTARILTPYDGKPSPGITYILDNSAILRRTRSKEWWHCVFRKFNPRMDGKTRTHFMQWMSNKPTVDSRAGRVSI